MDRDSAAHEPPSTIATTNPDDSTTTVAATLMAVDSSSLREDANEMVFERIYAAANTILGALKLVKAASDESPQWASLLAPLVRIPFLVRLFDLRQLFHEMAVALDRPDDTVALVCWVDHILAGLSSATLTLLESASTAADATNVSQAITKHREEAALHAASQLPHSWEDTLALIGSEHASPAAIRLALHLLYAVYVIGPQLDHGSSMTDNRQPPASLLRSLQSYIHRRHDPLVHGQRIAEAMAVSLFAVTVAAIDRNEQSPFRPHTQATLLSLMGAVLPPLEAHQSVLTPVCRPEPQLTALCGCGNTVEWCWTVWDDERISEYDVILRLTSTWLYHLGPCHRPSAWHGPLLNALARNPDAIGVVVAALLRRAKAQALSAQITDESVLNVLLKCVQAAAWLLNGCDDVGKGLCFQIGKGASSLFVLLGDTDGELRVKDVIIELLSYVPSELFSDAIGELSKESTLKLKIRLDDKLRALRRSSADWDQHNQCRAAVQMIQFAILVTHSKIPFDVPFHPQTLSRFFTEVIAWLSSIKAERAVGSPRVLQATLTALSISGPYILEHNLGGRVRSWTDEDIWELAIDFGDNDALTKSAFAAFVNASITRGGCNSLWQATALDFLRDFLFEVTSLRLGDEDQSLFVYARTMAISAMNALLDHAGTGTAEYLVSSPWTGSLRAELHKLSEEDENCYSCVVSPLAASVASKVAALENNRRNKAMATQSLPVSGGSRDARGLLCFVLDEGPSLALLNFCA